MKSLSKTLATVRGWADDRAGNGTVVAVLRQGFDWAYGKAVEGMPGLEGAEELAVRYAARHPTADRRWRRSSLGRPGSPAPPVS